MDNLRFNISIPSDEDGCVLFQCPNCGELFKVVVDEYESDSVLDIHCPLCGLISDNFFTGRHRPGLIKNSECGRAGARRTA